MLRIQIKGMFLFTREFVVWGEGGVDRRFIKQCDVLSAWPEGSSEGGLLTQAAEESEHFFEDVCLS